MTMFPKIKEAYRLLAQDVKALNPWSRVRELEAEVERLYQVIIGLNHELDLAHAPYVSPLYPALSDVPEELELSPVQQLAGPHQVASSPRKRKHAVSKRQSPRKRV